MTPSERDQVLLVALMGDERLTDEETNAFGDMLTSIAGETARFEQLTERQRAWAESVANRLELDVDDDPAERNRNVPRGKEVAPAAVLLHRPLKPPGRR